jgi:hypothetical protein
MKIFEKLEYIKSQGIIFWSEAKWPTTMEWNAKCSDVLGQASSPEPAEPSPSKPKPSPALMRACSGLGPSFRFWKPKPGAQAQALTLVVWCKILDWKYSINNFE